MTQKDGISNVKKSYPDDKQLHRVSVKGENKVQFEGWDGFVWLITWSDPNPSVVSEGGEVTVDLAMTMVAHGTDNIGCTAKAYTEGFQNGDHDRNVAMTSGSMEDRQGGTKRVTLKVPLIRDNQQERRIVIAIDSNSGTATLATYHYTLEDGNPPLTPSKGDGPKPPSSPTVKPSQPQGPDISGQWIHTGMPGKVDAPTQIIQNGGQITIINEFNDSFSAVWENATTFFIQNVAGLPGGMRGTLSNNGNQINWSNNTTWVRASSSGNPVVSKMTLRAVVKEAKPGEIVNIPVWLQKGEGLIDMNFNVTYDPSVALAQSPVIKGNLLDGASFEANAINSGKVEVGLVPRSGGINSPEGTVAVIAFKAVGRAGTRTPLTIVRRKSSITGGRDADLDTINGEIIITDTPGRKPWIAADALDALKMSVHLIPVNMDYDADKDGEVTAKDARLIADLVSGKKF